MGCQLKKPMSYTASEKILQRASGKKEAAAGDFVEARPDFVAFHGELAGNSPHKIFKMAGKDQVFDPDRVAAFIGHHNFLSNSDYRATEMNSFRNWCVKSKVGHIYDMGTGMMHFLMMEQGLALPGSLIVGGDSHTVAYGAVGGYSIALAGELTLMLMKGRSWFKVPKTLRVNIEGKMAKGFTVRDLMQYAIKELGPNMGAGFTTLEWTGDLVEKLSVQEKWILAHWAYEMGAGASYITPNEEVITYCKQRAKYSFSPVYDDPDAVYAKEYTLNISELGPLVAVPYHPGNTKDVEDVAGAQIQQAYVGGCTGGNIESLRQAATILKGRKAKPSVRLIIVPGTREIAMQAMNEGLYKIFYDAGGLILPAYCGPCQMFCVGNLGMPVEGEVEGETMIGTHPRNYPGRAGKGTKAYLASPYTVAASAVEGAIADPRKYLEAN